MFAEVMTKKQSGCFFGTLCVYQGVDFQKFSQMRNFCLMFILLLT